MSVVVTGHAVKRAKTRHRRDDEPTAAVSQDVEEGWGAGRRLKTKPRWARLFDQRARQLPDREWFVHDEERLRGWIVKETSEGLVVVTSLHRTFADGAWQ